VKSALQVRRASEVGRIVRYQADTRGGPKPRIMVAIEVAHAAVRRDGRGGDSDSGSRVGGGEYDEDNEAGFNESWGGIKVRVMSRRESVVEWE
jgi:hypothetical protein